MIESEDQKELNELCKKVDGVLVNLIRTREDSNGTSFNLVNTDTSMLNFSKLQEHLATLEQIITLMEKNPDLKIDYGNSYPNFGMSGIKEKQAIKNFIKLFKTKSDVTVKDFQAKFKNIYQAINTKDAQGFLTAANFLYDYSDMHINEFVKVIAPAIDVGEDLSDYQPMVAFIRTIKSSYNRLQNLQVIASKISEDNKDEIDGYINQIDNQFASVSDLTLTIPKLKNTSIISGCNFSKEEKIDLTSEFFKLPEIAPYVKGAADIKGLVVNVKKALTDKKEILEDPQKKLDYLCSKLIIDQKVLELLKNSMSVENSIKFHFGTNHEKGSISIESLKSYLDQFNEINGLIKLNPGLQINNEIFKKNNLGSSSDIDSYITKIQDKYDSAICDQKKAISNMISFLHEKDIANFVDIYKNIFSNVKEDMLENIVLAIEPNLTVSVGDKEKASDFLKNLFQNAKTILETDRIIWEISQLNRYQDTKIEEMKKVSQSLKLSLADEIKIRIPEIKNTTLFAKSSENFDITKESLEYFKKRRFAENITSIKELSEKIENTITTHQKDIAIKKAFDEFQTDFKTVLNDSPAGAVHIIINDKNDFYFQESFIDKIIDDANLGDQATKDEQKLKLRTFIDNFKIIANRVKVLTNLDTKIPALTTVDAINNFIKEMNLDNFGENYLKIEMPQLHNNIMGGYFSNARELDLKNRILELGCVTTYIGKEAKDIKELIGAIKDGLEKTKKQLENPTIPKDTTTETPPEQSNTNGSGGVPKNPTIPKDTTETPPEQSNTNGSGGVPKTTNNSRKVQNSKSDTNGGSKKLITNANNEIPEDKIKEVCKKLAPNIVKFLEQDIKEIEVVLRVLEKDQNIIDYPILQTHIKSVIENIKKPSDIGNWEYKTKAKAIKYGSAIVITPVILGSALIATRIGKPEIFEYLSKVPGGGNASKAISSIAKLCMKNPAVAAVVTFAVLGILGFGIGFGKYLENKVNETNANKCADQMAIAVDKLANPSKNANKNI